MTGDGDKPKKRTGKHLFQPGQSGNPKGRKPGSRELTSVYREQIAQGVPTAITKLMELAQGGDTTAIKLILDRVVPPLRPVSEPIKLELPPASDITARAETIVMAVASGQISTDDGLALLNAICALLKVREGSELAEKVQTLEDLVAASSNRPAHRVLLDEQPLVYGASDDDGLDVH